MHALELDPRIAAPGHVRTAQGLELFYWDAKSWLATVREAAFLAQPVGQSENEVSEIPAFTPPS